VGVKLAAVAVDYDGTIARNDTLEPAVRDAIAALRTRGLVVLLVTGRILDELRRVAGDLHFVDAVVAENGALIHFPDSGHTTSLGPEVPPAFIGELNRRRLTFRSGHCLVDAAAVDAPALLDAIRGLALPLVLLFNGGRVMTMGQGLSKATGLQAALHRLRLSPRNTLAIGDAENDHELLRLAEVGVAVEWGSPALVAAADIRLPGDGPRAVADYLHTLGDAMPTAPRPRRRLLLGYTEDGREFALAVRGRNVLIAGDPKTGKSWAAGLLSEQLILHGYCVCIVDPEGDYRSLEALPGVTVLGGEDPPPTPRELLRALRYPDRSVVIDLSHQPQDEKIAYIRSVLPTLNVLRRRTGLPHRIVLDEAHYFLHDTDARSLLDLECNGYTVVTYCASRLPAELLAATEVMIATCESNPDEIEALWRLCRNKREQDRGNWSMLAHVRPGQAVALPITAESDGQLRLFTLGPRLTPHVRHREKYVDVPVTERHAFVFAAANGAPVHRARTLRQFVLDLEARTEDDLGGYLRRGDFSRWIGQVFGDRALAADLAALEERHRKADRDETVREIVAAIRARYDLVDEELSGAYVGKAPGSTSTIRSA
jgi:hydroxymethylpyrimidine pyrophosphatase-like HAD family hydrolase